MSMNISNENEDLELLLGRVKQYLGSNKDVDVAKALGIGASTISTWRKRHSYSNDVFIEFALVKDISLEWLFRGVPPMMVDDLINYIDDDYPSVPDTFALVPRHDVTVSGGTGAIITSEQIVDYFAFNKIWLQKHGLNEKDLVLVEVVGDSMTPVLSSGDTVLVDMSQTDLKTGAAYVIRLGDELLVKYVQRLPGGIIQISSENRDQYPSFNIDLDKDGDEVAVVGRVISSSRNW